KAKTRSSYLMKRMRNKGVLSVVAIFWLLLFPLISNGQSSDDIVNSFVWPKHYTTYQTTVAPVIDGNLEEQAWKNAAWTDTFIDIEGDKKPGPALATRAKMIWDDSCLYIAAELEEPHIWATLTKH